MKQQPKLVTWQFNPITGKPSVRKRFVYKGTERVTQTKENCIMDEATDIKLQAVLDRIRWKGARRIRNYRFTGNIPTPKNISYYIPDAVPDGGWY